jgi:hypothetical protein
MPPMLVAWPLMYFVAECVMIFAPFSNPCSNGFDKVRRGKGIFVNKKPGSLKEPPGHYRRYGRYV